MMQTPTPTLAGDPTVYVGDPDIPAGITIPEYRLSRPRPVGWWRPLLRLRSSRP